MLFPLSCEIIGLSWLVSSGLFPQQIPFSVTVVLAEVSICAVIVTEVVVRSITATRVNESATHL